MSEHGARADHATIHADLAEWITQPLGGADRPAFRAICLTAPEADDAGNLTWIAFIAAHVVIEGGNLAAIMRGRNLIDDGRPVVDAKVGLFGRLGAAALARMFRGLNLLAARLNRKRIEDFAFRRLSLDRADAGRVA